ncbi:MAG: flavodoxin domain-containing protein [Bacteroidetes bacterium]|nr:flavodoxin domain-containing protein [Bacteroidota bacterium]MBL6942756.1 flavodoxin domain-containing protein [Bacteroidales bacterium]
MKKIVLLYWGKGGNVENTAHEVYKMFDSHIIDMFDLVSFDIRTIENYDLMILGHSTIGAENWEDAVADNEWNRFFRKIESKGGCSISAASFGLGDQVLYPDNFVDGLGIYKDEMDKLNISTIGSWPSDGYNFTDSDGEKDGFFYGLALDVDNEPELSEDRIKEWTDKIKKEIGI